MVLKVCIFTKQSLLSHSNTHKYIIPLWLLKSTKLIPVTTQVTCFSPSQSRVASLTAHFSAPLMSLNTQYMQFHTVFSENFSTTESVTESDLSSGGVIGITAGLTLLVALPVGVVLGCWGRIWWTRPAQDGCSSSNSCWKKKRRSREQRVIYEEPDVVGTTAIPLSDNEAYITHQV